MKSRLIPAPSLAELSADQCRELLSAARRKAAQTLWESRRRSKRCSVKVFERAYAAGELAGMSAATRKFEQLLAEGRDRYRTIRSELHDSAMALSLAAAESIVGSELHKNVGVYQRWMREAIEVLGRSSELALHAHPDTIRKLASLLEFSSDDISLVPDPTVMLENFEFRSRLGSVSFAWREALASTVEVLFATTGSETTP